MVARHIRGDGDMATVTTLRLPTPEIISFCEQWKVAEMSLFGSVLREDFGPNSDVDILATFAPDATWTLMDMVDATDQLEAILGRPVDLVTRPAIERSQNWIRRAEILGSAEQIYRAG